MITHAWESGAMHSNVRAARHSVKEESLHAFCSVVSLMAVVWLGVEICTSTRQLRLFNTNNTKLLDESSGRTLAEINHSKIFLAPPLKSNETKIRK